MTEWFKSAFGQEYLSLYAHRNDAEALELARLILREIEPSEDALVLDAPCGAGRHIRAFAEAGLKPFGFDLSMTLLEHAMADATPATIARADLRAIPFRNERFDLVTNLFSSLGYFDSEEINRAVVQSLVQLCRVGGWLVVDFMNAVYVTHNLQAESARTLASGARVKDRRWIDGDPPRVNKTTEITSPDGGQTILRESVRLFKPEDLRGILADAGALVRKEFGTYRGDSFDQEKSQRIILMAQRVA